jgi:enoyl-CoA hydratase/carnithine racemase
MLPLALLPLLLLMLLLLPLTLLPSLLLHRISAAEALQLGIVSRVVPAQQLDAEVHAIARQIARSGHHRTCPPLA